MKVTPKQFSELGTEAGIMLEALNKKLEGLEHKVLLFILMPDGNIILSTDDDYAPFIDALERKGGMVFTKETRQ